MKDSGITLMKAKLSEVAGIFCSECADSAWHLG